MPTSSAASFDATDFQLVLLRRMADFQPDLVDDARRALGATSTRMREANARWQRMNRSAGFRGGLGPLRGILGTPLDEHERAIGAVACRAAHWLLPLWPALRFEAVAAPGGALVATALVRGPHPVTAAATTTTATDAATATATASSATAWSTPTVLADLAPWSCVIDDVQRAFPPVRHREGTAPSRWTLEFTAPGAAGRPVPARAEFVWGLLQRVDPLADGAADASMTGGAAGSTSATAHGAR